MNRSHFLQRLPTETFDLCIIGGGASGAGCALDAALRGLKVVLVERDDFAAGTSSKSTKLIHGGVRYLEQAFRNLDFGQLRQVRHGLEERHALLTNAPHLARPLALVTPVFTWWSGLYFRIGLWLYDQFASRDDRLPASRWLSKHEARTLLPGLTRRLHSAVRYYDGQLDDARYCLALVQSAVEAGAVALNHLSVTDFEKDARGRITAARAEDRLQEAGPPLRIRARCFLNCTGPYADTLRRRANPDLQDRIRPSKGVHLMLPPEVLGSTEAALLIPKTPDGRVVFALPFQGKVLLGTTDQDYPTPDQEPLLENREIGFLLETLLPYLDNPAVRQQVSAGFGGLRPLIAPDRKAGKSTKKLVRDHEVEFDPASGLFSLLGGKWTTYRLMASDAVDAVCRHLNLPARCQTLRHTLTGGENFSPLLEKQLQEEYPFSEDTARHLAANYGTRARAVAELTVQQPELHRRLCPDYPFIEAEVVYAARTEMACTLRDVLARRIRLEILSWQATRDALPAAADRMAAELGWSPAEKDRQIKSYEVLLDQFVQTAAEPSP